jgi:hypothetical protein
MLRKRFLAGVLGVSIMFTVLTALMSFWIMPRIEGNPDNPRTFVRNGLSKYVEADDVLGFLGDFRNFAVMFYAKRHMPTITADDVRRHARAGRNVFLIADEADRAQLEKEFPEGPGVVSRGTGARRKLVLFWAVKKP